MRKGRVERNVLLLGAMRAGGRERRKDKKKKKKEKENDELLFYTLKLDGSPP